MLVSVADQDADFAVDQLGRLLRIRFFKDSLAGLRHVKADISHLRVHTVVDNLSVGTLCHFLQVILGSGCDTTEKDLFRHTSTERHTHSVKQLFLRVQILLFGQVLGVSQALTAWNYGYLKLTKDVKSVKVDFDIESWFLSRLK